MSSSDASLPSTLYGSSTPAGLTPNQIRGAYGLGSYTSDVLSNGVSFAGIQGDGRGQTIAIVDAYDDPTALSDVNAFSTYYGLPTFNGSGDPTFEKLNQSGGTSLPGTDPAGPSTDDWEIEEAMDIEWAHAIVPMANIILFEATNDGDNGANLYIAAQTAANTSGVVTVSMSWAFNESSYTASQVSTYDSTVFTTPSGHIGGSATLGGAGLPGGVTFLAAAGDNGPYAGDGTTTIAPQYPATSPNVIAVGGTSLTVDGSNPNYTYGGETAWGDGVRTARDGGGGGGISTYESQPSYQSGVVSTFSTTQRTYPDVSAEADPNTGVPIYDSYDDGTSTPWNNYNGGTSLSCPIWAGIITVADEGRAIAGLGSLDGRSQTLPELYKLPAADFHDITSGSTGSSPTYNAGPGYDLASGLGSPVGNMLIPALVDYQPTVTGISPSIGPLSGGTVLTITGAGFSGATDVDFGTTVVAITSSQINATGTQITVTSPAGTGTVNVTVIGPGGASAISSADQFTYNPWTFLGTGVFTSSSKTDLVWENTSTGQILAWVTGGGSLNLGTVPSGWTLAGIGDVNGDGKADLVWQNTSSGEILAWITGGGGMYLGTVPSGWTLAGVGDVNSDGKADLVWQNTSSGVILAWITGGGGMYLGTVPSGWTLAGVGDFNGDGKADLLWQNTTSGEMLVWLTGGNGLNLGTVPSGWTLAGIGDFNGDGKADLLWQNATSGVVLAWITGGSGMYLGTAPLNTGWTLTGVGDFTDDGMADVLWQNQDTGVVLAWITGGSGLLLGTL